VSDEQLEADTYVGLRDPLDSRHVIRVLSEPASPRVSLAAFGCLLLGGYAWIMSDRIRTSETPIRPDSIAAPVLTGFWYFMLGWSVVIVVVAVLQGFGVINWNVRL